MYMYDCGCPIRPNMSKRELIEEIYRPEKYCTSLTQNDGRFGYICPNLNKEMARAITVERAREQQAKQMKKQGYTEDQIKNAPRRVRRTRHTKFNKVDIDEL